MLYGGNHRLSGSIYYDKALGLGVLFFKLIWLVFGSVVVFRYCQSKLLLLENSYLMKVSKVLNSCKVNLLS